MGDDKHCSKLCSFEMAVSAEQKVQYSLIYLEEKFYRSGKKAQKQKKHHSELVWCALSLEKTAIIF